MPRGISGGGGDAEKEGFGPNDDSTPSTPPPFHFLPTFLFFLPPSSSFSFVCCCCCSSGGGGGCLPKLHKHFHRHWLDAFAPWAKYILSLHHFLFFTSAPHFSFYFQFSPTHPTCVCSFCHNICMCNMRSRLQHLILFY